MDGFFILLTWMLPIYAVAMLSGVVVLRILFRVPWPSASSLLLWIAIPAVVWSTASLGSGRWLAFFNAFLEPTLLSLVGIGCYSWAVFSRQESDVKSQLPFWTLSGLALLIGLFFPAIGESP
mgnify:CR=1 FL=1